MEKSPSNFLPSLVLQLIAISYPLLPQDQDISFMVSVMSNPISLDRKVPSNANVIELVLQHIERNNSYLKMASRLLQLTQSLLAQMKTLNRDKLLHQLFQLVLKPFHIHQMLQLLDPLVQLLQLEPLALTQLHLLTNSNPLKLIQLKQTLLLVSNRCKE